MTDDVKFMKAALRLAARGKGRVSPNPLVGAVIVKNGTIIGSGYHQRFGGNHAEINALSDAGNRASGAALFCNLEPCSHHGKTPPCVESIIKSGVKEVVIGMGDPNPLVNGRGIKILKDNGITVKTGVLEKESIDLNAAFIKFITKKIPYVTVKMAQTIDGKIAAGAGLRTQISGEKARKYVHRLRTEYDAVLVGKNTAAVDDPLLTPRLVKGRTPKRYILDTNLELSGDLKIFNTVDKGKVCIVTSSDNDDKRDMLISRGVDVITVPRDNTGKTYLSEFLKVLGGEGISSVLVEGGAGLFSSMIKQKLIDNVIIILSPLFFGSGKDVIDENAGISGFELGSIKTRKTGRDLVIEGKPVYNNG
ncbi:MAG: bifunctional diaminohydroxyphosphoribosylaminopyrimidine deaminase/5-amino-6-(5-phosphoribosylamino)uracil reductase RibD [bacterium]|nr:bifunctional diaminohydroxyphosphoribosylaminopyrimidine deaminase/5-amino-6-(5-phosphoribosylamino)uracil reductase RibD [bacterium]